MSQAQLLTLRQAGARLLCRDPRTARKRLAALGVPVIDLDGRTFVREAAIERALMAHERPLRAADARRPTGVHLAPGERLGDTPRDNLAPRAGRRRGRGVREESPAARPAYPAPGEAPADRSPRTSQTRRET